MIMMVRVNPGYFIHVSDNHKKYKEILDNLVGDDS